MNVSCDVLVVGAGAAGVPAAVAAARAGADTLLAERRPFPGGAGVAAPHRHICGLYPTPAAGDAAAAARWLNGGLAAEICARLRGLDPKREPMRLGRVDVLPYSPDHLAAALRDLMAAERRLEVRYGMAIRRATLGAGRIQMAESAAGTTIGAAAVVDCSGGGVVIQCSPLLREPAPPVRQLAGYVIRLDGLDTADGSLPIAVPYAARRAADGGLLPASMKFASYLPGDREGEGWCKVNVPAGTPEPSARALSDRLIEHLKGSVPAFRRARVVARSGEVLEREGARLKGWYTLSAEDVLSARSFPDAVARGAWPVEMWEPEAGPRHRYLDIGKAYDIPARCLHAAAASNLFCAGRCISATREALGSTRVMGICMALGEAAGRAAAEYARGGSGA